MAQTVSALYQCYLRLSGEAVEDTTHAKDMVGKVSIRSCLLLSFLMVSITVTEHVPMCPLLAGTSEHLQEKDRESGV